MGTKRKNSIFGKRSKKIKRFTSHQTNASETTNNRSEYDTSTFNQHSNDKPHSITNNEANYYELNGSEVQVDSESSKDLPYFELDDKCLVTAEEELIHQTNGLDVEDLGKIFCQLMEIISKFMKMNNRSEMAKMLLDQLKSIKKRTGNMNEIFRKDVQDMAPSVTINP